MSTWSGVLAVSGMYKRQTLGILGFVPGFTVAGGLLAGMKAVTTLPLAMTAEMAIMVFIGTLAACSISGAIATRRLASADPADLF